MPLHYFRTLELPTSKCDFKVAVTVRDPVAGLSVKGRREPATGGGYRRTR